MHVRCDTLARTVSQRKKAAVSNQIQWAQMGSPASAAGESAYCIESSIAGSTRVVLVASEPITQSSGDWVAVPTNTALVVSREKGGCIDIIRAPLAASACHVRQEEVKMCAPAACIIRCHDAYLMSPCP